MSTHIDIKSTLRQLSECDGPFGQEGAVADLIKELLAPVCDEVRQDDMLNVYGVQHGSGPEPRPQLMLMAHMDEIQMFVSAIEGPFLRFHHFSYDTRALVGQEVVVLGRKKLFGIIGDRPPHLMMLEERKKAPAIHDLVIDVGLDAEAVTKVVQVGDSVLVNRPMITLLGDRVAGKAFDNRLSITALLAALHELKSRQHLCDIIAVASVSEEHSSLGARTATYRTRPDVAIVLDVTFGVQPGAPGIGTFELGGGPVIGVGPNLHDKVSERLIEACDSLELSYGIEPLAAHSGTDAWNVQIAAGGVPCGLVGVAIRNMHTPVETVDLKDVTRTARVLAEFAATTDRHFVNDLAPQLPDFTEGAA